MVYTGWEIPSKKFCNSSYDKQYNNPIIPRESALATSPWGILYAGNAGVVSQSPEQSSEILMGVIGAACAAFSLTVSKATTEITMSCVYTRRPQACSVERQPSR